MDDEVGIKDRGLAKARAYDAGRAPDKAVRVLFADLDRRAGLEQPHLLDDVQDKVGDIAHGIGTVHVQAAGVDLGEIGIGAALGGRHADLGRGRLVVELDPQALQ